MFTRVFEKIEPKSKPKLTANEPKSGVKKPNRTQIEPIFMPFARLHLRSARDYFYILEQNFAGAILPVLSKRLATAL
jgi:hypothetical protein